MRRPLTLNASKVIAVHLNYADRIAELGLRAPDAPDYFLKPPSTLSWDGAPVVRPAGCQLLNYEGELAIVIGRRARRVAASEALQYVRGYTAANDFGVHDFRHADRGSMLRAKGIDGLLPLGPVIADATGMDPSNLTLRTYVNGKLRQQANTAELLFPCEYLIADLTRLITLERDDVILTGTPANSRPVQPGDEVEVEIEGIGRISNTVVPDDAPLAEVGAQPHQSDDARRLALGAPIDRATRSQT